MITHVCIFLQPKKLNKKIKRVNLNQKYAETVIKTQFGVRIYV